MITFTEKEVRILNLVDESLSNYDPQKSKELSKVLDDISIQNENKIESISIEIKFAQQFNSIFNLDFQTKLHQTILDSSNKNPSYDTLSSLIIEKYIKSWHESSQFVLLINDDSPKSISTILESVNKLLTRFSEDFISIDENLKGFVFTQLISDARKANEQRTVEIPEDLENNASMNPRETGMKFYVSLLKTLNEGKARLKDMLDNQIKEYAPKDNDYEKNILALYYIIAPHKIFSDRYIVYKKKKFEKVIPKPKSQQESKEYLDFIKNSFRTIKSNFVDDCTHFVFDEKFGKEHIVELTQLAYITKIESLTNELSGQFSDEFCQILLRELSLLLDTFTSTFTNELDASLSEIINFRKILGGMARNVSRHILSACYLNIENDVRKYFETISAPLREMTIAKENVDAEAKEVGKTSHLINIDMSTKATNYVSEYGLVTEKEKQAVFHKQFETFGKEIVNQEEPIVVNTNINQPLFSEFDLLKSPINDKSKESANKKEKYTSSSMSSIYREELLDYSTFDSVNLGKDIKYAKWIEYFYIEYPFQRAQIEKDLITFERILPVRISLAVLNLLNKIDPIMEGLIKVLSYFDLSDSYVEELKKKIATIIDSTEYHIFEYLNEIHSSGLLILCDWIFLNFTYFNYLNYLFLNSSTVNKNNSEFFKGFIQSFLENSNKLAAFLQKNYVNEIFLISLPSIDNQDWTSFRPYTSSEIKEETLKNIITHINNPNNQNLNGRYVRNINYGLRMWKSQIQRTGLELQNNLSDGLMQIIGLKIYLDTVLESLSSIYIRYKCIHPSRIRNPQFVNDLRFIVNEAYEYSIIVFGLMLSYFEIDGTNVLTSEKIYLCTSFLSIWKTSRLLRIQLAIMELDYNSLAQFLKDCIDEKIKLPKYSEEEFNQILDVAANLKTVKMDKFTFTEKEKDLDSAEVIQETKRIDTKNSSVLEDGKNQVKMINEFVNKFQKLRSVSSLDSIYESLELILESSKTDLEKGEDKSIYLSMNTINKNKSEKSPSGSQTNLTPAFTPIKEDLQSRIKAPLNPMLKHSNNIFLKHSKLFDEKSLKSFLKNPNISPQHVLFILKKRIEYTTDQYPQLTEENKKAQKTLNPLLRDFCAKFEINMITIPAE